MTNFAPVTDYKLVCTRAKTIILDLFDLFLAENIVLKTLYTVLCSSGDGVPLK